MRKRFVPFTLSPLLFALSFLGALLLALCSVGAMLSALCLSAEAQQPKKVPRIGFLGAVTPEDFPHLEEAFREGLREFGFVEGKTLVIEYRWAEGRAERLPEMAADLARLKVDALFAITSAAARAAKDASTTIPVVFVGVSDPVRYGLVASLARPGGNMTGLGHFTPELNGKRLELLKEVSPGLGRVAVLWNTGNESHEEQLKDLANPAKALGVHVRPVGVEKPEELEAAFQVMVKDHARGLVVLASSLTHRHLAESWTLRSSTGCHPSWNSASSLTQAAC